MGVIKVVSFDVLGTVIDASAADRDDISRYVRATRDAQLAGLPYQQLAVPKQWNRLRAHSDAEQGIRRIRSAFRVVTCSNLPISMIAEVSRNNGIDWDFIVPVELRREWKPSPGPYRLICETMRVEPQEVAFVTANRTFGDLEASAALGMKPFLIRDKSSPFADINDLAAHLLSEDFA